MVDLNIKLPDDFLEEEIRCGYTVTRKMKKVWAVELDLLNELLRVCNKYNIKIFASGGTMLGAVRHKGFIPWDDDIDMGMLRKDYDKLCKIANKEFQYPYFFQTNYTDPGTLRGHAQLRNSNTTSFLQNEGSEYSFNQGIFIDIFPMDFVTENGNELNAQKSLIQFYYKLAGHCSPRSSYYRALMNSENIIKHQMYRILKPIFRMIRIENLFYSKFEKECRKYNSLQKKKISYLSYCLPKYFDKKYFEDADMYEEIINMPFEFLQIPVSKFYDQILTQEYGDYHKYVIGSSMHGEMKLDPDKSYKEYLK